ncbi:ABC transporter, partial [Bifidobacteriaceae bacterium WP012]
MLKKSTLICMRLFSAFVSAIISVGFLASMCCCNCGSAYADEAVAGSELENANACHEAQLANNAAKPSSSATSGAKLCRVKEGHTDVFATYKDANGNLVLGTRGDSFPGSSENSVRYNSSLIRFVVGSKSRVRRGKAFSFVKQNVKHVYRLPSQNNPG